MENSLITIPHEKIIDQIFVIRGKKVMFDRDLAKLYGVETKVLNQAVKRNSDRFPKDFSFILTQEESNAWQNEFLRSQFVTLKQGGHIKHLPRVFTEQGVAMLSSVLKSKRAIQVNIEIVRTFTRLREILSENKDLRDKIEGMEKKYDKHIADIFKVIRYLKSEIFKPNIEEKPKGKFGFSEN
ncbi:MAG: ORF6N domain-containing protein [Patescibacteria group bacterium]